MVVTAEPSSAITPTDHGPSRVRVSSRAATAAVGWSRSRSSRSCAQDVTSVDRAAGQRPRRRRARGRERASPVRGDPFAPARAGRSARSPVRARTRSAGRRSRGVLRAPPSRGAAAGSRERASRRPDQRSRAKRRWNSARVVVEREHPAGLYEPCLRVRADDDPGRLTRCHAVPRVAGGERRRPSATAHDQVQPVGARGGDGVLDDDADRIGSSGVPAPVLPASAS